MRINREDILEAILKHKNHFYRLIDIINNSDAGLQFPMSAYLDLYEKYIDVGSGRYADTLSMSALIEANVFVNVDRVSAMITLSKEVYNILVWLDISRKKQLDSQLFESHRLDILRLSKDLARLPIDSQDFKETYSFFYEKMSDIQSDISENVRVLEDRVDQIADMYKNRELGLGEISLDDIYEKAQHIYNRNILPCLQFINPNIELVNSANLSETLKQLELYFEGVGEVDKARILQFRVRAVFCYYKDIGSVADRLNSYLTSIAQDRRFFLSMEKAFGVLTESLVPLRHGGGTRIYLNPESKIFGLTDIFDGLKQSMTTFETRLNYSPNHAMDHFENHFDFVKNSRLSRKSTNNKQPVPLDVDIQELRNDEIMIIALIDMQVPDCIEDVHLYIWEQLQHFLPDATMIDFLYALSYFLGGLDDDCIYQRHKERSSISDDNYYFDYPIWDYIKDTEHG